MKGFSHVYLRNLLMSPNACCLPEFTVYPVVNTTFSFTTYELDGMNIIKHNSAFYWFSSFFAQSCQLGLPQIFLLFLHIDCGFTLL